jgi:aspartate racemase
MAAHYVENLLQFQPEGPYLLGGYSMGGTVAFEMAQQLVARGHTVAFLGIIDTSAQSPRLKWLNLVTKIASRIFNFSPEREREFFIENRHRLWLGLRKVKLPEQSGSQPDPYSGEAQTPPRQQLKQQYLRLQKITASNVHAHYRYVPRRYPGNIVLFKSADGYTDIYRHTDDPQLKWQHVVRQGVQIYDIPGNHNQIMDEPHVNSLAAAMAMALDKL